MNKPQTDVEALRRLLQQKQRRRTLRLAAALALAVAALVWATGLFGDSIALLYDGFETISLAFSGGKGFPADTAITGVKEARAMGRSFALLGDRELAVYTPGGGVALRLTHGYARPAVTALGSRLCLYDRGGKVLQVTTRTRQFFKKTLENNIQLCAMGPGGTLVVVTENDRYAAELNLYDANFERLYTWYSAEDIPTRAAIAPSGRFLAVGCPVAQGGALGTHLYLLDAKKPEPVARIDIADGLLLDISFVNNDRLIALYDRFAVLYDAKDGKELARYEFAGRPPLLSHFGEGGRTALVFGDVSRPALNTAVVLSPELKEIAAAPVGKRAEGVALSADMLYILSGEQVLRYNLKGEAKDPAPLAAQGKALLYCKRVLAVTQRSVEAIS